MHALRRIQMIDAVSILKSHADEKYADFQWKLTPGIEREKMIGVKVPEIRKIAKYLARSPEHTDYMSVLPHYYYDENMLHALLINEIKDYKECVREIDRFLPYVDNWAVCDAISPKILGKDPDNTAKEGERWLRSEKTYTCRAGIGIFMRWFLDDLFKKEYSDIVASVRSDDYYVRMMVAWYFATALAKQWGTAVKYLEEKSLDPWTHNKTIRKATESYRITDAQKEYLRKLTV